MFNTQSDLKGKYVLKGGTVINFCLFDLPRLSVDIDLNFNGNYSREDMEKTRILHKKIIIEQVELNGYTVSDKSRFTFTLDSYLLQYRNAVGGIDYIKLELNYSNRLQLLTPVVYKTISSLIPPSDILALNKIELYATKIAALVGRTTARDIFDIFQMIEQKMIKPEELELLRKLSIFFLVLSNEFEPLEALLDNFSVNLENIKYINFKRNLIPMLKVGTIIDIPSYKSVIQLFVNNLFNLSINEKEFVNLFNNGTFKPELLFSGEMVNIAKSHPMAIWKNNSFKKNVKE